MIIKSLLLLTLVFPFFTNAKTYKAATASNQFGFELFEVLSKKDLKNNIFYSSLSIEAALAMTSAGAQKETLEQMLKTLHIEKNDHAEFKKLFNELKYNRDYQLNIANQLWGQAGTTYNPDFLKVLKENYNSDLTPLNFKRDPEKSRLQINEWVEKETAYKINNLLEKGVITSTTDLVITNAVYFKSQWSKPFNIGLTTYEKFNKKTSVPFMNKTDYYLYGETVDFQLLEMPYKGDQLVMNILLPKVGKKLNLNLDLFSDWLKKIKTDLVKVSIPKFKIESKFDVNDILKGMGMVLPFDEYKANFHGIREIKPNQSIYISNVIHQAFIAVDEEGTEAAAATAVAMRAGMGAAPKPVVFKANRPFVVFIRHVKTGAILFMGRITKL